MATVELYRGSTFGMCLKKALDEMVSNCTLNPEHVVQVLVQFDKPESQVKSKVTFKDALFKKGDSRETVGLVKIVARDSQLILQ